MELDDDWERDDFDAARRRLPRLPYPQMTERFKSTTPKHIGRQKVAMLRETLERKGA